MHQRKLGRSHGTSLKIVMLYVKKTSSRTTSQLLLNENIRYGMFLLHTFPPQCLIQLSTPVGALNHKTRDFRIMSRELADCQTSGSHLVVHHLSDPMYFQTTYSTYPLIPSNPLLTSAPASTDFTLTTQTTNYYTLPSPPANTHTYFTHATAQLSSPTPTQGASHKIISLSGRYIWW